MASVDLPLAELPKEARLSRALSLITAGRLCLIPVVITTFMTHPLVTTLALLVFMGADLGDGLLARHLSADDRLRRATDSTVDRIGIDACLLAASANGTLPWTLFACFVARDVWCAVLCGRVLAVHGVVVKGDLRYRVLTASFGAWGLMAPFVASPARTMFAVAILTVATVLVVDYTRAVNAVLTGRYACRNQTVPVTAIRNALADGPGRSGSRQHRNINGGRIIEPPVAQSRCTT